LKKSFRRNFDSIGGILEFIEQAGGNYGLNDSQTFNIEIVVEELFTNQIKYASGGTGCINISITRRGSRVFIELEDFNVQPFDISERIPLNANRPIEERTPGGLGLHLVTNLTEDLKFDYRDKKIHITAIQSLEDRDVRD